MNVHLPKQIHVTPIPYVPTLKDRLSAAVWMDTMVMV